MKTKTIFILVCLLGIFSAIFNIKYEQEIKCLKKVNNELKIQIEEKDQLIEDYQFGINQIEFIDECFIKGE